MSDDAKKPDVLGRKGTADEEGIDESPTTPLEQRETPTLRHRRRMVPELEGFELIERIGAGGMGEVWSAEQREGIRRRVAVKLIRPGMGSNSLIARFEGERQALAMMDHAAIARVFGAGTSVDGRPFFVMELVKGIPIDQFSDRGRLGLRQRLDLFLRVCAGVQHAHQKAIIHRDLKPSNILVTRGDGVPSPKIIDFGLAKAVGHRLAEETMFTGLGEMIGTPEFMSPEQADPRGEEVDTRTDVYALGMVLYVLLVGSLPFDRQAIQDAGLAGLQRIITTVDPPRPSTRVSQLGDASERAAERRDTTVPDLSRSLRGDLDWIVMKALAKDPDRRYATVDAMAADIERFLDHRAIEARPPSVGYRARKFVRRHTLEVVAAVVVTFALVAGAGFAAVGLVSARAAEREARQQAETADRVSEFMVQLFEVSDPSVGRGRSVTAREVLDRGWKQLDELDGEPLIKGRLEHTLGRVYTNLGLFDDAGRMLDDAVDSLSGLETESARGELAAALHNLGVLYDNQGRYTEAEEVFRDKLALAESHGKSWDHELARTLNSLAIVLNNQGRYDESLATLERSLEVRKRLYGEDSPEVARSFTNLGHISLIVGETEKSEAFFTRALEIQRELFADNHPDIAGSLNNLGSLYQQTERLPEARAAMEEALAIWTAVLDENHPDLAIVLHNLGDLARDEGNPEQSLALFARSREILIAALGEEHLYVAMSLRSEATSRRELGQFDGSERLFLESLEIMERAVGSEHPEVAGTLEAYSELLDAAGRSEEAEAVRKRRRAIVGE